VAAVALQASDGSGFIGMIFANLFIAIIVLATLGLVCCHRPGEQQLPAPAALAQRPPQLLAQQHSDPPPAAARPPRAVYLDNLKVLLTAIVVNHHSMMALGAPGGWFCSIAQYRSSFGLVAMSINQVSQSYFMCLFFFISGLFTPGSYDKAIAKGLGRRGFLRDKFLRLGVPFLFFLFGFGPLLDIFTPAVITGSRNWLQYQADPGPPWFLSWLLLFNICYAVAGPTSSPVARPSLPAMVLCCVLLGLIQAVMPLLGVSSFALMPVSVLGNLPFDVAFFMAGCCASAKRSNWLEAEWLNKIEGVAFAGAAVSSVALIAVLTPGMLHFELSPPPAANTSNSLDDALALGGGGGGGGGSRRQLTDTNSTHITAWLLVSGVIGGCCTILVSVWLMASFHKRFNKQPPRLTLMANAAFAVYLIHPWVIVPLTGIYIAFLRHVAGIDVQFDGAICDTTATQAACEAHAGEGYNGATCVWGWNNNTQGPCHVADTSKRFSSSTDLGSDGYVWLGWIFVGGGAQLLVWPVAHLFRQLPFVRQVL